MSKKTILKMILDIVMTVMLFIAMSYQFTGEQNHEIFGTILLVAFIIHHILNWRWYVNLGKGKYTSTRILTTAVDFVILVGMFLMMFSGMRISGFVFKWMDLNYSMELARTIHMRVSFSLFLFLGIHIGLHYSMIMGMVKKMLKIKKANTTCTWVLRGIALVISAYGVYALIKREFFSYILGIMHFLMFDYSEPVILYELDLLAIMILMAACGYYLQKLMVQLNTKKLKKD